MGSKPRNARNTRKIVGDMSVSCASVGDVHRKTVSVATLIVGGRGISRRIRARWMGVPDRRVKTVFAGTNNAREGI